MLQWIKVKGLTLVKTTQTKEMVGMDLFFIFIANIMFSLLVTYQITLHSNGTFIKSGLNTALFTVIHLTALVTALNDPQNQIAYIALIALGQGIGASLATYISTKYKEVQIIQIHLPYLRKNK